MPLARPLLRVDTRSWRLQQPAERREKVLLLWKIDFSSPRSRCAVTVGGFFSPGRGCAAGATRSRDEEGGCAIGTTRFRVGEAVVPLAGPLLDSKRDSPGWRDPLLHTKERFRRRRIAVSMQNSDCTGYRGWMAARNRGRANATTRFSRRNCRGAPGADVFRAVAASKAGGWPKVEGKAPGFGAQGSSPLGLPPWSAKRAVSPLQKGSAALRFACPRRRLTGISPVAGAGEERSRSYG